MVEITNNDENIRIESVHVAREADGVFRVLVNTNERWLPFRVSHDGASVTVFFGEQAEEKSFVKISPPLSSERSFFLSYDCQNKDQLSLIFIDAHLSLKNSVGIYSTIPTPTRRV